MERLAASPPQKALALLQQGGFKMGPEWEKAHAICQTAEGTFDYDLVHALAHWIEGDMGNRDYWYRRVTPWVRAESIEAEAAHVAARLAGAG
jgi:hypothetical protein